MYVPAILIVLCASSVVVVPYSIDKDDLRLDLIHVIFRHGARTPERREANSINVTDASLYKPYGFSQLTNTGKNQAYTLGQQLRKKYEKFLGQYKFEDVYALSTDHARTVMSLQLVLAGLYPPNSENRWNPSLEWTPVPFHQSSSKADALLEPNKTPGFWKLYQDESSEEIQRRFENYTSFVELAEENTGKRLNKKNIMAFAASNYNAVKIHKEMNLPLPDWITDEVFGMFKESIMIGFETLSFTPKLKRINGGSLVQKVIENIDENEKSTAKRKIYLYSCHDLTLSGYLIANGIELNKPIEYSSAVIVESYKDYHNNTYVKMTGWNGEAETYEELKMRDCQDEYCPLKNYKESVKSVIPSDEDLKFFSSR